jgi:virulence-associated protein E/DNA primase RepB-like protein/primase-like protein
MVDGAKSKSAGDFEFDFDTEEARKFLNWVDPDAKAFDFRALWPKEKPAAKQNSAHKLPGNPDSEGFVRKLKRLNENGYGIFVTVNETDGKGVKVPNITRVRAVWADVDHGKPREFPLTPSFIIETSPGRYQAYWLVHDEMAPGEFANVMARIVQDYGGDAGAADIARVLRVPGFYHTKGEPFRCRIVDYISDSDADYTAVELAKAFPPVQSRRTKAGKRKRVGALAAIANDFDPEIVASALAALPDRFGTDYNTKADEGWRNIMFAIHHGLGGSEEGWEVLDEWSRQFHGYDRAYNRKLWDAAQHDRCDSITLGTLFHHAEENDWERPEKTTQVEVPTKLGLKKKEAKWLLNGYGKPADHIKNVEHFISDLKDIKPWFNEFDRGYYLDGYERGDRLDDAALRDLRMQMHKLDCRVSIDLMESGVKWLADQDIRHPLRDWINSLEWDRKRRMDRWLITLLGARDTDFIRAIGRASLIALVRRVRQPGCLVREMLVLEGPQGVGKSSVIKTIAGEEYFSDSLPLGADAKVTIEETVGKWLIEFPELSSKTKKEVEEVKASISRTHDTARTAYARTSQTVPRQFVMWATTNNDRYLRDRTGNTRFLPCKVGEIDLDALREDREQLLAEAAHYEKAGEAHWLTGNMVGAAARETSKREVVNPIEEKIAELLSDAPDGFVPSEELWRALGLDEAARRNQYHLDSMGDATRKLGWRWARKRKCDDDDESKQVPGYVAPGVGVGDAGRLKYDEDQRALVNVH